MKKTFLSFFASLLSIFAIGQSTFPVYVVNTNQSNFCYFELSGYYTLPNDSVVYNFNCTADSNSIQNYTCTVPSYDSLTVTVCAEVMAPCLPSPNDCVSALMTFGTDSVGDFGISILLNSDVDNDLDGFPASVDCDDNNSNVNPYAVELCDGIDNNCDGVSDTMSYPVINMYFVADSLVSDSNSIYVVCQVSGANSYMWDFNGLSVDSLYTEVTFVDSGNYNICLYATNEAGCVSDSCLSFEIDSIGNWSPTGMPTAYTLYVVPEYIQTSISEITNDLLIYPNPTNNSITISNNNSVSVQIMSLSGNVVYSQKHNGMININVENLSNGIYILNLTDGKTNKFSKFVKQ